MSKGDFEVTLTRGAEADLEGIYDYLARHHSMAAASSLLDSCVGVIASLESHPDRGSHPSELQALGIREFRQILMGPYRIIYRVTEQNVVILVIADGRRDMQALLERRLLGS